MAKYVLAGGTDVAEVALFNVDSLSDEAPDESAIQALESDKSVCRFPTGADGAYLLHLLVDEPIPASLIKYCNLEDKKESQLRISSGKIAFGGIESASASFKPNSAIRSDTQIPPGLYRTMAYYTEYPDDLIQKEVEARIGHADFAQLSIPGKIMGASVILCLVGLVLAFFISKLFLVGLGVVIAVSSLLTRRFTRAKKYVELVEKRELIENEFPSIVVQMNRIEA